MRSSIRNQLNAIKQRLDRLEPKGDAVITIYPDDPASKRTEFLRANPDGMVINVMYEGSPINPDHIRVSPMPLRLV